MKIRISLQSQLALSCAILFISGLKAGIGPFLVIYLKSNLGWNPTKIGMAVGIMNFAAILNYIPSGLLIDEYKIKRHLLIMSCLIIAISSLLISFFYQFSTILMLQFLIGLAIAIIPQAIVALTLGLMGKEIFPMRTSTNEALSNIGNIILALIAGLFAFYFGNIWILYIYSLFAVLGIIPVLLIKGSEINHAIARELIKTSNTFKKRNLASIRKIVTSSANILFFISVLLFHFSSAAQLTLIGQLLVTIDQQSNALFMANSIIVSHITMMIVAIALGFQIQNLKRKPIFQLAFVFIFIRGILFTFYQNPYFFLLIQILDGISGGIFGVMSVVLIAELAAGTGRFNFMHAIMVLCQGLGYVVSNIVSGYVAQKFNFNVSFYMLSVLAILGLIFFSLMPETYRNGTAKVKL